MRILIAGRSTPNNAYLHSNTSRRRQTSGVSMQTAIHHPLEVSSNDTPACQHRLPFVKKYPVSPEVDVYEHPLHRSKYMPWKGDATPTRATFSTDATAKLGLTESQTEAASAPKLLCHHPPLPSAELRDIRNATSLRNEWLPEENKQINDDLARRRAELEDENATLKREVDEVQMEKSENRLGLMTAELPTKQRIARRKVATQSFLGLTNDSALDDALKKRIVKFIQENTSPRVREPSRRN